MENGWGRTASQFLCATDELKPRVPHARLPQPLLSRAEAAVSGTTSSTREPELGAFKCVLQPLK